MDMMPPTVMVGLVVRKGSLYQIKQPTAGKVVKDWVGEVLKGNYEHIVISH